jgi:hypothetical protein
MEYNVQVDVTGSKPDLNEFKTKERLILLGSVQTNVVQIDYERLKELLDYDLKERWNVPVEQEMIRLGRRLMPEQFSGESLELSLLPEIMDAINDREADLERDEEKKEDLVEFRYLEQQVKTPVVPGHLAFWVELENGGLKKWDSSNEREVSITGGSIVAKFLYVLVPNWQLFWLSDSMNPQAEELGETRFKTKYDQGIVPVRYLGTAGLYVLLYVTLALSAAIWMFENRELDGNG